MSDNAATEPMAMWAARELADETAPPEITLRRFLWLFMKTWPFMKPMLIHIVFLTLVWPFIMTGVGRMAALGSIVARLASPASERATHRWLRQRSGVGELLGVDFETVGAM